MKRIAPRRPPLQASPESGRTTGRLPDDLVRETDPAAALSPQSGAGLWTVGHGDGHRPRALTVNVALRETAIAIE